MKRRFALINSHTAITEVNDLTAAVTWATVPDAFISSSSVTQWETALTITESQISDLGTYLTDAPSDGSFYSRKDGAWAVPAAGVTNLPDLGDVTTAAVTNRFALMADGAAYVGRALVAADIPDLSGSYEVIDTTLTRSDVNEDITGAWTAPSLEFVDLAQAADEKRWLWELTGSTIRLGSYTDAGAFAETAFLISRTGTNIDSIAISGDDIDLAPATNVNIWAPLDMKAQNIVNAGVIGSGDINCDTLTISSGSAITMPTAGQITCDDLALMMGAGGTKQLRLIHNGKPAHCSIFIGTAADPAEDFVVDGSTFTHQAFDVVTHAPDRMGPGSGVDADTVDGIQGSTIMQFVGDPSKIPDLDDLDDCTVPTPTNADVLTWNNSSSQWEDWAITDIVPIASQAQMEAGTETAIHFMSPLRVKQAVVALESAHGGTVSQADAEAGTSTTDRLWTAQRVKQAIVALESGGGGESVETKKVTASETRSTSTYSDSAYLAGYTLAANTYYKIEGFLQLATTSSSNSPRFRIQLSNADQASAWSGVAPDSVTGHTFSMSSDILASLVFATTSGRRSGAIISGFILSHATLSSTLDLQFSLNTGTSTATLHAGSWLSITSM